MKVAFWLLFVNGLIGLYDAIYYHILTFKLYKTQVTFWEQLTHWIRGFFYACFYILVCIKATGVWWWIYPGLIALEVINTSADVMLEPYTRRSLGGVPPTEYTLHCIILLIQGAALCSLMYGARSYPELSDGIAWAPMDLGFFSWLPIFSAVLAIALSSFEGFGFLRMTMARITGPRSALASSS